MVKGLFLLLTIIISLIGPANININESWSNQRNKIGADLIQQLNIPADSLTIYITPTITNELILPDTDISSDFISNQITLRGTPGEFKPFTFIVRSPSDIPDLTIKVSDLIGISGIIPNSAVDIRVVKSWYQDQGLNGSSRLSGNKILVPELLLKDDSLVKAENNENYLKLTDGTYRWISDPAKVNWYTTPEPSEFPVQDSSILQPVNLLKDQNKQFWVLIKIPDSSSTGSYSGNIILSDSSGELSQIKLQLEVLPFTLSTSILDYGLFYFGESSVAYPDGTISHQYKSDEQLLAEYEDMVNHGITNISLGAYGHDIRDWYNLHKSLSLKDFVGMDNTKLFYNWLGDNNYSGGLDWKTTNPDMLKNIKNAVQDVIDFSKQYGTTDVYVFGFDEVYDPAEIIKFKASFQAVHDSGGKVYISGSENVGKYFKLLGNSIDLRANYKLDAQAATQWHSIEVPVYCYGNPQVGVERPETYRRNYGLMLWQNDYDGTMNWAYQSGGGDIWNDFDSPTDKDLVFAYPTINGVIDTLEWEGWREAVTDIKYLSTLMDRIKVAKTQGRDTSGVEQWISDLKSSDLSIADLDEVRSTIIDYILGLIQPPEVTTNAASNITKDGATLNGYLNNTGTASQIEVSFEYGLTNQYGSTIDGIPSDLSETGNFSAGLSDLTSNTLYHYRAKAVGDYTVYGTDQTFQTSSDKWWVNWWQYIMGKLRSLDNYINRQCAL